jgi:REP element-mobilizing transposase RayT
VTYHARRLPHYHALGRPVFLTWRLHGSLPAGRSFPPAASSGQAFLALDRLLDHAHTGPLCLRMPQIAQLTVDAIHFRANRADYDLHAYVIMPNHVHLLITPRVGIAALMQSLKRFTARQANLALGLTGVPFWQDESYDREVRNPVEFQRIAGYIEKNPVTAGLSLTPETFPWSSAAPITNRQQDAILPHQVQPPSER